MPAELHFSEQLTRLSEYVAHEMPAPLVSASIVAYKTSPDAIRALCNGLKTSYPAIRLLVVDNAASAELERALEHDGIEYLAPATNVGFGRAHNLALERVLDSSAYHLFVNPDIQVLAETLPRMIGFLDNNPSVGAVMPRVLYPDNRIQHQCKLLPSPMDLFLRRFAPAALQRAFAASMLRYDLRHLDYQQTMEPPVVSGCFLAVRTSVLAQTGGFDPRFFMYLEDFDLCRRIHEHARLVYLPAATVVHEHGKGSYKSFRLLKYHLASTIRYFNKWGWFSDRRRSMLNRDEAISGNVWSLNFSALPAMSTVNPLSGLRQDRLEIAEPSLAN